MNTNTPQEIVSQKVQLLSSFKEDIRRWFDGQYQPSELPQLHSEIEQNVRGVRNIVMETSCLKLMPTLPPSVTRGLVIRDYDPFNSISGSPHDRVNFIPAIVDMIDEAIRVLESPRYLTKLLIKFPKKAK
jgi:hypothetical protein